MGFGKGVAQGPHMKFDPEIERLVQEVKAEMIREGLRYSHVGRPPVLDREPKVYRKTEEHYKKPDWWPIQFRGTPDPSRHDRNLLIKTNHDVIPLLKRGKR